MNQQENPRRAALRTYMIASLPGWLVAAVVTFLFYSGGRLPMWGMLAIVGAVILTDLVQFPRRRRYYTSEPATTRLIGGEGVAVSELAPRGFVRIKGELWQAAAIRGEDPIPQGETVRIEEVRGLELIVDRAHPRGDSAAARGR